MYGGAYERRNNASSRLRAAIPKRQMSFAASRRMHAVLSLDMDQRVVDGGASGRTAAAVGKTNADAPVEHCFCHVGIAE